MMWPVEQGPSRTRVEDDQAFHRAPPSEPPPPVAGGNGQRLSLPQGDELDRPQPLTFRHRHEWGWQCSWCGATETGFDAEHHARTLGDEHTRTHLHPEFNGGMTSDGRSSEMAETGGSGGGGVLVSNRDRPGPDRADHEGQDDELREARMRKALMSIMQLGPSQPVGERPWLTDAACRGMDPGLFYPERGDHEAVNRAKAVCARCPVREECLDAAFEQREIHGIWGGMSERERRRIRSKRYHEREAS